MKSYLLILDSAVSLGFTSILYKKSTQELGAINTTFFYYLFGAIIAAVAWVFFPKEKEITLGALVYPYSCSWARGVG